MRRPLAIAAIALAAVACSGDGTEPSRERIELDRTALELFRFQLDSVRAVVYDRRGDAIDASVAWASSDTTIVSVDARGVVLARWPGRATVTAKSGTLDARAEVTVIGDGTAPKVDALTVTPSVVDLGGGEVRVVVSAEAWDDEGGVLGVGFEAFAPSAAGRPFAPIACASGTPVAGTSKRGTWSCAWVLNRYAEAGTWTLRASARDTSNTGTATLTFRVRGSLPDVTPPLAESMTVGPYVSGAGHAYRHLELRVTDSESGIDLVDVWFAREADRLDGSCNGGGITPGTEDWRSTSAYTLRCEMPVGPRPSPWIWNVTRVMMRDVRGNVRELDPAALRAAGFPTEIDLGTP